MRQVVHNLVTNAIKYSIKKACKIVVNLEQKEDNYVVSVRDSGIGIPKKQQAQIFQKFFRLFFKKNYF